MMIVLDKTHKAFWPRLTREKKRLPFISVDFERWKEESSSDGEKEGSNHVLTVLFAESHNLFPSGASTLVTSGRRPSSRTCLTIGGHPPEMEQPNSKYGRILGSTSASSSENYEDKIDDFLY